MVNIHDGVAVGAEGAGGHEAVEAMLQAGGVVGSGAASRIAHENGALHGNEVTEMGLHGIQNPHDVPNTFADEGTSHKQGSHGGALTGGAVLGAAADAKGSLLNGQRRKPLGYGTDAEVAVASRNGLLVAGILG